jgi:hypothetical protein
MHIFARFAGKKACIYARQAQHKTEDVQEEQTKTTMERMQMQSKWGRFTSKESQQMLIASSDSAAT